MPIKFSCAKCQKAFTVADSAAGKQGRCKDCGHLNTIPEGEAKPAGEPAKAAAPMFEVRSGVTGAVFGPADQATLKQWVGEQRITSDCRIRKVGRQKWTAAGSIFPALKKNEPAEAQLLDRPNEFSDQSFQKFKGGRASEAMAVGRGGASTAVNPFASGSVSKQSFGQQGDFAPTSGNIGFILGHAFKQYQENLGTLLGAAFLAIGGTLLLLVAFYAALFIAVFAASGGGDQPNLAIGIGAMLMGLVFYILFFLGCTYLGAGQMRLMIKVGRGEPANAMDIFSSGNRFLHVLGYGFIANLLVFGILVFFAAIVGFFQAAAGPQNAGMAEAVGGILIFILLMASVLLMWPGVYLIVDRRTGIMGAFSLGASVAIKNIGQFIVISLVAGLIYLAGALMLGVGIIFSLPLAMLIIACAYLNMTGQIRE